MNRKISRFNMDKSGQSYDIEPRGFSAFKADVLRRIASIQNQIDILNGQTPSSGSGSSSGGSSSGSGSSSSSSSGTTGSGGTVRNFTFKSNRKNTTVTVRYKKRDDIWVEKTATIPNTEKSTARKCHFFGRPFLMKYIGPPTQSPLSFLSRK